MEDEIKNCKAANFLVWMSWSTPGLCVLQLLIIAYFAQVRLWSVQAGGDKIKQFEGTQPVFFQFYSIDHAV